jgi:hypothetical protein
MITKKNYPPIGINEAIRRIKHMRAETGAVQKTRRHYAESIESVSDVFSLSIQYKLAQKCDFVTRRIVQKSVYDRIKKLGLLKDYTADVLFGDFDGEGMDGKPPKPPSSGKEPGDMPTPNQRRSPSDG